MKSIEIPARSLLTLDDQLLIYSNLGIPPNLPEAERAALMPLLKAYCEQRNLPYLYE